MRPCCRRRRICRTAVAPLRRSARFTKMVSLIRAAGTDHGHVRYAVVTQAHPPEQMQRHQNVQR